MTQLVYSRAGAPVVPSSTGVVLGLEDFGVVMQDNQATLATIEQDLHTTGRIAAQSDQIEKFVDVVDNVECADPVTLGMIDVAADMATVGTDVNAGGAIVTGIESWENSKPSLEGFTETARAFLEWVLKKVAAIWEHVKTLWANYKDLSATVKARALKVQTDAADKKDKVVNKTTEIKLGLSAKHLVLRGMVPKTSVSLNAHLNEQLKNGKIVYSDMANICYLAGKEIITAMGKYQGDNGEAVLDGLNLAYLQKVKSIANILPDLVNDDTRFNDGVSAHSLTGVIGNQTLYLTLPLLSGNETEDAIECAQMNRKIHIRLWAAESQQIQIDRDATIPQFPASDVSRICTTILDLNAQIEQYRAAMLVKLTQIQSQIDAAISQAGNRTDRADNDKLWKALSLYSLAFSALVSSGTQAYTQQILNSATAALQVCERNLDSLI